MNSFSRWSFAFLTLLMTIAFALDVRGLSADVTANQSLRKLNQAPLAFTENQGQWDERVKFRANAGGATMWFATDGIYYQFTRRISKTEKTGCDPADTPRSSLKQVLDSIEHLVIRASFVGANPDVEIVGEELMEYKCNYFIGNDPAKWRTDVPNYEAVTLHNVYEGVDLRFQGSGGGYLMYEYSIAPGVDADQVVLEYDGLADISRDESGAVTARTMWGDIEGVLTAPDDNGFGSDGELFAPPFAALGQVEGGPNKKRRSHAVVLVYDMVLWDSYPGGGLSIAVDESGNAYVTGTTGSTDFPTINPYQAYNAGVYDVFVAKLNPVGDDLVYSTYLGGSEYEVGRSIAIDVEGSVYVTGSTVSSDFPTVNPYQEYQYGDDVFVAKLSSAGNDLVYSTCLGGDAGDAGHGISVDAEGNAYVTGYAWSSNFPTVNPYQTHQTGSDAFVTKLNSSGNDLIYSTFLGGWGGGGWIDEGNSIAVDAVGNAYVVGYTECIDFPTVNPFQADPGDDDGDGFVTKLNATGNDLLYSTYLGGDAKDLCYAIAVDAYGSAYVTGYTASTDFPTVNPYQTDRDTTDVFVAKLNPAGSDLTYSTYLGGGDDERGYSIAVDADGSAYVSGWTKSTDFPTQNAFDADHNGDYTEGFVAKLSAVGNSLIYSTFLVWFYGNGRDIALDAYGSAYVTLEGGGYVHMMKLGLVEYVCGDADGSSAVDIDDVVYLIAYIFSGGLEPVPYQSGDADCSGAVDIDDVVYLISYIFSGGNTPCDTDGDEVPDC
jgi:hypothetical protein